MGKLQVAVNVNAFTHTADFQGMLDFIRTADELGYGGVRFVDHVVGVVVERHPGNPPTPYTHHATIHEVFTLMAYLCALTKRVRLITGVLGLPQRETALVAKQAAEVDNLSGGRVTLGVGIGYNPVEFQALNANFKTRARRFEEQVAVLRALWTQEYVDFTGDFHNLVAVNVNPLPVQQPIPIWIGAGRTEHPVPPDVVLERIGRLGDGWCPLFRNDEETGRPKPETLAAIAKVNDAARRAGRDPGSLDLELGLYPSGKSRDRIVAEIDALRDAGATWIHTRFDGGSTQEQIDGLKRFKPILDAL